MKPDSNSGFYRNWNNNMIASNNFYLKKVIIDGWYEFNGSNSNNSLNNFQNTYSVEYVAIPGINYICNCFSNSYKLSSLQIQRFNTEKVETMIGMFRDCSSLTSLDLDHFRTPSLTSMSYIFQNCKSFQGKTK